MWISYFLPRWVTNHEEISGKSAERFANAMKVVAGNSAEGNNDHAELFRKRESQLVVRRILFTSILGFTAIIGVLTLVGMVAPVIILIPISTIALYLVHARHQIAAMHEEIEQRRYVETERNQSRYQELIARSRSAAYLSKLNDEEQWIPLSERALTSNSELQTIVILPKGSAAQRSSQSSTWEPTSVPAPRYLNSSKAAPRRVIDLTIPGAWSEREAASNENSSIELFDQVEAEELERQLHPDRAVNE